MFRNLCLTIFGLFWVFSAWSQQREEQLSYVERYAGLAVWEMERAGVPASIKLGQAILESRWGTTDLARIANNHFGIKCGGVWEGLSYMKEDDDYDARGNLIPSCFRRYESAEASFVAHSEFLKDPLKSDRYGFLFDLDPGDYKAWARGLKKAGYATDKDYHHKLIRIIESLKLFQYDRITQEIIDAIIAGIEQGGTESQLAHLPGIEPAIIYRFRKSQPALAPLPVLMVNRLRGIQRTVKEGQQGTTSLPVGELFTYRAATDHPVRLLKTRPPVVAGPERSSYRGKESWHVVRPNELMADISRLYGLKLKALYQRNLIPDSSEVAAGERIKLKGNPVDIRPLLRPALPPAEAVPAFVPGYSAPGSLKADPFSAPISGGGSQVKNTPPKPVGLTPPQGAKPSLEPIQSPDSSGAEGGLKPSATPWAGSETTGEKPVYHVVKIGETLWSIARQYGKSAEDLMLLNEMKAQTIVAGMAIRVR